MKSEKDSDQDIEWFDESTKGNVRFNIIILLMFFIISITNILLSILLLINSQFFLFVIELIVYFIPLTIIFLFFIFNIPHKIGISNNNIYFVYLTKIQKMDLNEIIDYKIQIKKQFNKVIIKSNRNITKVIRLNDFIKNKLLTKID